MTGPGDLPCKIVIHTVGKNLLVETGLLRQPTQLVSLRFTCNQSWSNIKKRRRKVCSKLLKVCSKLMSFCESEVTKSFFYIQTEFQKLSG